MKNNQILYDKFGNELIIYDIEGTTYRGTLKKYKWVSNGETVQKEGFTEIDISFSDEDMGVLYFYSKEDIGNRMRLLSPSGMYASNSKNIKKQFDQYVESLKDKTPYGEIMLGDGEKQKVINSFFDATEKEKDKNFIAKNSDCFARMDLDTNFTVGHEVKYFNEHYHDVLYISKKPYERLGNVQIVNWKAEIANLYYSRENLHFSSQHYLDVFDKTRATDVEGILYDYSVMLRREFDHDASVSRDTYVCGTPEKENSNFEEQIREIEELQDIYKEGGIDPFLIKVLEEKRLQNKLTDIIISIQANQNAMIRHTPKKNMIVQGCAGSGKTMIMLHRISYLLYNRHLRNVKRAVIIVPNSNFNVFINELTGNLDIDQVPRYTMSQFYLKLIYEYQAHVSYNLGEKESNIEEEIKSINHKDFINANITNQNELFNEELEYAVCEYYDNYLNELRTRINSERIEYIYSQLGYFRRENKSNEDELNNLYQYANSILGNLSEKTIKEKKRDDEAKKNLSFYRYPERRFAEIARIVRDYLKEKELTNDSSFSVILKSFGNKYELEEELEKLRVLKIEYEKKVKSESKGFLRFIRGDAEAKKNLEDVNKKIEDLEIKISDIHEDDIGSETLEKLYHSIDDYKSWKDKLNSWPADINAVLDKCDEWINRLFKEDIPFIELTEDLKNIIKQLQETEAYETAKQNAIYASEQYEAACSKYLSLEDRKIVEECIKVLRDRSAIVVRIFEQFANVKLSEINSPRHLFILLALYLLHVGNIKNDCDYIFVDEAQDYADIEYHLLRGILGDKTIFEVYGDYMQCITPNRGIDGWEQMKILLEDDYYELEENYRNTVEIAEFVNENIHNIFRTIGLHGDEVKVLGRDWEAEFINLLNSEKDSRIAIIYKNETIKNSLNIPESLSKYCYTVIDAKGLEFENVFVVEKGMTDNERYIAYSRALNKLYVLRSH